MHRIWLTVALVLTGWVASAVRADHGFEVREARLLRQSDVFTLTAKIDYDFSPVVIDALNHGVPLTLTVKARIRQSRLWFRDPVLWRRDLDFRIQYYPLARVYRVIDEANRFQRSFTRLKAALEALGDLQEITLPVAEDLRLAGPGNYAEVVVKLNLERLPWALRTPAYFSPAWHLRSPIYRWPLPD